MNLRKLLTIAAITIGIGLATAVSAHEAAKGPNGGLRVDAGKYHTELVADGTTKVVTGVAQTSTKAAG